MFDSEFSEKFFNVRGLPQDSQSSVSQAFEPKIPHPPNQNFIYATEAGLVQCHP